MLAGSCICGTISKYQNGMSKVARKTFNIGEVWNPVILGRSGTHGNKTVELVLWSTLVESYSKESVFLIQIG